MDKNQNQIRDAFAAAGEFKQTRQERAAMKIVEDGKAARIAKAKEECAKRREKKSAVAILLAEHSAEN